jgi:ACS family glucarate transporter-like MFS transporter
MLFGFSLISYFDRTIISIAGPRMLHDFGLSTTQMGAIYSAFIFGYALFMIPGGHLTDRLGPRTMLATVGWSSAVFTALTVLGGNPALGSIAGIVPALVGIRFGLGAVTAPLYPACARMSASCIPAGYNARVQGLIIAGSSAGAAISPMAFTWLIQHFQWRVAFVIAALVTAGLAALWQWQSRNYPKVSYPRGDSTSPSWLESLANTNLMLLTFAYGALGYFQYIFFYWMYYYFGEVLHFGPQAGARYTTILFLTEGAMIPLGGLLSDRVTLRYGAQLGRRVVPMISLTLSAVLLYCGTLSSGFLAVGCLTLAFGFAACCEGPFWATVTEMSRDRVGGASSILNTGAQVGGIFAPIITPWIASHAGWSAGIDIGCLAALSAAVAVYFIKLRSTGNVDEIVSGSQSPA